MTVATAAVATTERKRPPWRPSRGQAVLALTTLSALATLLAARVSARHLPPVPAAVPVRAAASRPAGAASTTAPADSAAARLTAAEAERASQAAAIGRLSASLQAAAKAQAAPASAGTPSQQLQLPPLPALPPVTVSRASGG